jgi:hypothetical protein
MEFAAMKGAGQIKESFLKNKHKRWLPKPAMARCNSKRSLYPPLQAMLDRLGGASHQ